MYNVKKLELSQSHPTFSLTNSSTHKNRMCVFFFRTRQNHMYNILKSITFLHSITFSIGSSKHQNRRVLDMHPRKILIDDVKSLTLPYDTKEVHRCTVLRRFEDKVAVLFRNKIEPGLHVLFEAREHPCCCMPQHDSDRKLHKYEDSDTRVEDLQFRSQHEKCCTKPWQHLHRSLQDPELSRNRIV